MTLQRIEHEQKRLREIRSRPALTDLRLLFLERATALIEARSRLRAAIDRGLRSRREGLQGSLNHLRALSPAATLQRGYAIVRTHDAPDQTSQKILRSATDVDAGTQLDVTLAHGHLLVAVQQVQPESDRST